MATNVLQMFYKAKKMKLGISTKIVIRPEQRKSDGTNVIYVRVTKDRKARYLSTGLIATSADLSKDRKRIKNYQLIDQAEALHRRARQILIDNAGEFAVLDASEIVERLTYYLTRGTRFTLDFFDYADKYIKDATKLAEATKTNHRTSFNSFREFIGRDKLDINDVTNAIIKKFAEDLERRNLSRGAISMYTAKIVAVYRKAQAEYNDDFATNIPRVLRNLPAPNARTMAKKRALTIEQIQQIISIKLKRGTWEDVARDMFVISLLLCGINYADIMLAKPPKCGIIEYKRSKIAGKVGDAAEMRIAVPEKLNAVLDKYSDPKGQFFISAPKFSSRSVRAVMIYRIRIGQAMEKLSKKLGFKFTFYSARHSFATIARNVLKVDKATIDECLTHVGEHRMTDIYIERDYSAVNSVCSGVANIFDLSKYNVGLDAI